MILYHVNAKIRYANQLDKGLFNLTINPNYIRESQIPKLQIQKQVTEMKDDNG